jgi:hypothetical protein
MHGARQPDRRARTVHLSYPCVPEDIARTAPHHLGLITGNLLPDLPFRCAALETPKQIDRLNDRYDHPNHVNDVQRKSPAIQM